MSNCRNIIALILCLAVLLIGIPVFSADGFERTVTTDPDLFTITIKGKALADFALSQIVVTVYREGHTPQSVIENPLTYPAAISYSRALQRDTQGAFNDTYTLGANDVSGIYTVYFHLEGKLLDTCDVAVIAPIAIATTLQKINDAASLDTAGKKTVFNEVAQYVGLFGELFDSLSSGAKDRVIISILSKSDYSLLNDVRDAFIRKCILELANEGDAADIELIITDYSKQAGVDTTSNWNKGFESTDFTFLYEIMTSGTYTTASDINTVYHQGVSVVAVNKVASMGTIYEILKDLLNQNALGISVEAYNSRKYKDPALKYMYDNRPYSSPAALISAWSTACALPDTGSSDNSFPGPNGPSSPKDAAKATQPTDNPNSMVIDSGLDKKNANDQPLFRDLGEADWAQYYINELAKVGIVSGAGDGRFVPNENITREQFLKMIFLASNMNEDPDAASTFTDADKTEWYYEYVATAQKQNLVKGISDDMFGIGQNITRQDLSVMAVRLVSSLGIELPEVNSKQVFIDDSAISDYALVSVYTMQMAGLINGYPDKTFRPEAFATRAEAAKIIYELCKLIIK